MKHKEVAEKIQELLPGLLEEYRGEFKEAERLRLEFTKDYPVKSTLKLKTDGYVVGKGASNRSFCYRLEQEMWMLGNILGSPAPKFGVYFGRTNSDPIRKYRYREKWGQSFEDAFLRVKQMIVDLLEAAPGDAIQVAQNPLPQTVKGKLLHLYFPQEYAPIYSTEHLAHFVKQLDLRGAFDEAVGTTMQKALMNYRATWPELSKRSPLLFMRFLYRLFGPPLDQSAESETERDERESEPPFLDQAVAGAKVVDSLPIPASRGDGSRRNGNSKPDYEANAKRRARIGDRGEAIVVELEKRRLIAAGRSDLAKKVVRVSDTNDRLGYDILSFEEDAKERLIEVKATTSATLDGGFFITDTELQQSKTLSNHYLYIVLWAMSKQPRIWKARQAFLQDTEFLLRPIIYHARVAGA